MKDGEIIVDDFLEPLRELSEVIKQEGGSDGRV